MGNPETGDYTYRQQIRHTILPNENHSTDTMERMSSSSISQLPIIQAKTTPLTTTCPDPNSLQKKLILRIREDTPTTPIERHVQSAGVSEDEQIFCTEDDDETEEQVLQRKKEARNHPTNQLSDISFEKFTTHKSN